MKRQLLLLLLCLPVLSLAQINEIVPYPAQVNVRQGSFELNPKTQIAFNKSSYNAALYLREYLREYHQLNLRICNVDTIGTIYDNIILLKATGNLNSDQGYTLNCDSVQIIISGDEKNVFYGIQTLIQLLPNRNNTITIPSVSIKDQPRMRYRGLHLDCSRHFFSKNFIKRYLDLMAHYKLNTFHWHLTDDQGWRIEIKQYPNLTKTGGCRAQTLVGPYGSETYDNKKYCGYYTQSDIKEIVTYAAARYINIIPEIEMPGHSMAALASYPYLGCTGGPYQTMQTWGVSDDVMCAGKDSTFAFLCNVLDEVIPLFPYEYVHIGGDECPKERWKNCAACTKRINDEQLKDANELQSYFIKRIEAYINSKGKKIIGWDEIMEGGLAPNAAVMSWRGESGGIEAAKQHHEVVMTPGKPLYFDHSQSNNEDSLTQGGLNSIKDVYDFDPIPKELSEVDKKYILGAQANVWTEYMDNENKVEYMICPRIAALSEMTWTPLENKNWTRFEQAIPSQLSRLDRWHYNYSKAFYDLQNTLTVTDSSLCWNLASKTKGIIKYISPASKIEKNYQGPIEIHQSGIYSAYLADTTGKKISAMTTCEFHVNKATGKKVTLVYPPHKNYAQGGTLTLADGIQNTRGMQKSSQFLGFWGTDLEATIDLKDTTNIHNITLHAFEQQGSWIYAPSSVYFFWSNDGIYFTKITANTIKTGKRNITYSVESSIQARYVKVIALNYGKIPDHLPGGGHQAWQFVDEISID